MTKKNKKIGIFTGYFLPHVGGIERYVDKLSESLAKIGYDIVLITSNHDDRKNVEISKRYSIYRLPIFNIAKNRYPLPRLNGEYKSLIKKIEQEDIDYFIVNTRFHLTSLVGARMGKHKHKPVMLIEHGTGHFTVSNKLLDFFGVIYEHILTATLKRYVDKFYGVSEKSNIWSEHFNIKSNGVFYNAINADDDKKVSDFYIDTYSKDEIVITYAGRLLKEKGILNLLDAFTKVDTHSDRSLRLVIAGDGELLEFIKKKYNKKNINIVGRLDFEHIMALYKRTDIFVYPSLYPEGLPTSILEAGLMECAIIATPRGGTEEVIIDNQHGIIIDGTLEQLSEAILFLVRNDSSRTSKAVKVKKRIKTQFDWDKVAKKVDEEIKNLSET